MLITLDGQFVMSDLFFFRAVTVRLETGKEPVACPDCKQLPNDIQLYLGDSSEAVSCVDWLLFYCTCSEHSCYF